MCFTLRAQVIEQLSATNSNLKLKVYFLEQQIAELPSEVQELQGMVCGTKKSLSLQIMEAEIVSPRYC